jgi:hypothetical protein
MIRMSFDCIDSSPRHYLLRCTKYVDWARYKQTRFVGDHRLMFGMELELSLLALCLLSEGLVMVLSGIQNQEGPREAGKALLDLWYHTWNL